MEFLILIGVLVGLFLFTVQLYFLVKVPKFLEDISIYLKKIYLEMENQKDD